MTVDHVHVSTTNGNPGCGEGGASARLSNDPELVTCPRCKLSATFQTRKKYRAAGRKPVNPPGSSAGVAVRADASLFLKRALKIIEQLPMRRRA